ncbi:MAG: GEVED domain-containing protein, partial [Bacteroidota bacterium]
ARIHNVWGDVDGLTYYGSTTATLTVVDDAGNENSCWSNINLSSPHYSGGVCAADGNTGYEYINSFTWNSPVEDFNVYSGDNDGYVFFTRERNIRSGDAVTITYSPGFVYGSYREYWRVYLDLNRDGDWDDSGEMLHEWNGFGGNTATINLPLFFGRYGMSRLRVVMSYGGYRDACATGFYGEVEDYAVRLTSPFSFRAQPSELAFDHKEPKGKYDEYGTDFPPANLSLPPRQEPSSYTKAYPNPAKSGSTITLVLDETYNMARTQVKSVELKSIAGQTLAKYPVATTGQQQLQLPPKLIPGLYLITGHSDSGIEWTEKLVVR